MGDVFIKIIFFIIYIFSITSVFCQESKVRTIDSLSYVDKLDTLNIIYGKNKIIPGDIKLCFLIALSYYPELSKSKVIFKSTKIKTTLNTRPTLLSVVFNRKSNRKYIIRINNSIGQNNLVLNQADFNSKIGVLGHELGHICDYGQVNLWGLIKIALDYSFSESKKNVENRIEILTIEKGLGWQLYYWSDFVLNKSNATERYKLYKIKFYLTPEQIKEKMVLNNYQM